MTASSAPSPSQPTSTSVSAAILLGILVAAMSAAAFSGFPPFISRVVRPLTARLGITADTGAGVSAPAIPEGAEKATLAAGCFWGVEHLYRKHFGSKGLYDARVGFTGGDVDHPSYRHVCTGKTGHAESVQLVYDPARLTYRQLLEFFYRIHDPTTRDRQGPDVGPQYRSAVFFHSPEQERVAREVTAAAAQQWYGASGGGGGSDSAIATQILPAGTWWDAEDYHQQYLHHNPTGYECPTHYLRTFPPLQ